MEYYFLNYIDPLVNYWEHILFKLKLYQVSFSQQIYFNICYILCNTLLIDPEKYSQFTINITYKLVHRPLYYIFTGKELS